ncbi:DUF6783 domain-containing protein [Robinsoniella peoriensis]
MMYRLLLSNIVFSFIRVKSPSNCYTHLPGSNFKTRSISVNTL